MDKIFLILQIDNIDLFAKDIFNIILYIIKNWFVGMLKNVQKRLVIVVFAGEKFLDATLIKSVHQNPEELRHWFIVFTQIMQECTTSIVRFDWKKNH